jgi:hypothetical protein
MPGLFAAHTFDIRSVALAGALLIGLACPALASEPITVVLDRAQVLKLPPKAQTVIIGNPMIADVLVQKNGSMVVTGKSFGMTNLIAQDAAGAVIGESILRVEAPSDGLIVVQRGMERESYSCTPRCQPAVSLGDSEGHFAAAGSQATKRSSLVSGSSQ